MHSIGQRLKEERKRLGFSQIRLCDLTGITRKTLFSYETDERSPNALFLAGLYVHDFDVDYILKGERQQLGSSQLEKIRKVAESAFQIVNSAEISVSPTQFAQMMISLMLVKEAEAASDKNSSSDTTPKNDEKKMSEIEVDL